MPARFAYYERLSLAEQAVYRHSDRIAWVPLGGDVEPLRALALAIRPALIGERCEAVRAASHALCAALCARLVVRAPALKVLRVRPRQADASELHGLYTTGRRRRPLIRVWMRTAAHGRVVAFRTYVRTLLHELCHHLDFELYGMPESFHTLGFFKRESSLVRQLLPGAASAS
jgi:hypothetical protein